MSQKSHRREPEDQEQDSSHDQQFSVRSGGSFGGGAESGPLQGSASSNVGNAPHAGDEVLGRLSDADSDPPILGEPSSNFPSSGMPAGDDLGDLLGSLLGDGESRDGIPSSRMPQGSTGDPLSDLLGSMFGGETNTSPNMSGAGTDPMGGLLGGLLGGLFGNAQPGMGGGGGMNSVLVPLADMLAERTGISRDLAFAALSIVVPMLMNKFLSSGQQSGDDPLGSFQRSMRRGQGLTLTQDEHDEMVHQLVQQTGLNHREAAHTLNQAMQVLSGQ